MLHTSKPKKQVFKEKDTLLLPIFHFLCSRSLAGGSSSDGNDNGPVRRLIILAMITDILIMAMITDIVTMVMITALFEG